MKKFNPLLLTDSPKLKESVNSSEPRTIYGNFLCESGSYPQIMFFGLQYYLKEYLAGQFVTEDYIKEAEELKIIDDFSPCRKQWEYILEKHNGKLPIKIKTIEEGAIVPNNNVIFSIENTDPNCSWLPIYLEPLLLQLWYPCSIATLTWQIKEIFLTHSNTDRDLIDLMVYDVGIEGVSSIETAAIGGCAFLVNFRSSGNLPAISLANKYYEARESSYGFLGSNTRTHHLYDNHSLANKHDEAVIISPNDFVGTARSFINADLSARKSPIIITYNGKLKHVHEKVSKFAKRMKNGFKIFNDKVKFLINDNNMYLGDLVNMLKIWNKVKISTENFIFSFDASLLQTPEIKQVFNMQYTLESRTNDSTEVFVNGDIVYTTTLGDIRLNAFVD